MDGVALGFAVAGIVFVVVAIVGVAGYLADKNAD
jgi:hypothetical protein